MSTDAPLADHLRRDPDWQPVLTAVDEQTEVARGTSRENRSSPVSYPGRPGAMQEMAVFAQVTQRTLKGLGDDGIERLWDALPPTHRRETGAADPDATQSSLESAGESDEQVPHGPHRHDVESAVRELVRDRLGA